MDIKFLHYVPKGMNPKKNRPVTIAFTFPKSGRIDVGFARCGKGDQFCRKEGRDIAADRLRKSDQVFTVSFIFPVERGNLRRALYAIAKKVSKDAHHYHQRRRRREYRTDVQPAG